MLAGGRYRGGEGGTDNLLSVLRSNKRESLPGGAQRNAAHIKFVPRGRVDEPIVGEWLAVCERYRTDDGGRKTTLLFWIPLPIDRREIGLVPRPRSTGAYWTYPTRRWLALHRSMAVSAMNSIHGRDARATIEAGARQTIPRHFRYRG